jgi:hypothetical protein
MRVERWARRQRNKNNIILSQSTLERNFVLLWLKPGGGEAPFVLGRDSTSENQQGELRG